MRTQAKLVVRLVRVVDALLVAAVLAFVWNKPQAAPLTSDFILLLLVVPFFQLLFQFFGIYDSHRLRGVGEVVRKVVSAQLTGGFVLALFISALGHYNRLQSLGRFFLICSSLLLLQKWIIYSCLRVLRRRGVDARDVCVISSWERAARMAEEFTSHPDWGLRISCVGIGSECGTDYFGFPSRVPVGDSLEDVLKTHVIDELIIAVKPEQVAQEKASLRLCEQYGVLGRILLDTAAGEGDKARVEEFCGELSLTVGGVRRSEFAVATKRALDFVLAVQIVILLAPVMLVIATLVKLSSSGAITFKQTRVGLNGRQFTMYKFRTMLEGAEALFRSVDRTISRGPAFKDPRDYRITDIGRLLRRLSLDELPQLFNVIKGDMSLVGPRPLPVNEAQKISGSYRRRFSVPPGITCIWQVNGRSDVEYEEWMKYDLQYVDGWSLWLDAKLLLRTVPAVISGRGAY